MSIFEQERVFVEAMGQTTTVLNIKQAELYKKLTEEEKKEFDEAWEAGDRIEMADAIIDSIVVWTNLGLSLGLPMQALWDEVLRSNMAKIGPDGKVTRREDGKVLKPAGWTAPDIAGVLEIHETLAADAS
ncbi:pyrophosphohydrolase domain-containing protein [Roseococcus pinisoli]|uniref:Phosphoribosyl-ATP diphosphatase n=1 Tax=Roseococcus pinisoli TaxID=2835040 RepID=A0ABS5QF32_9PROT|nr:hypothetical protein [Roseococcus pinisoli]MBS7812310.1 hypothetical protein [Roseococcus pinisoli]